MNNKVKGTTNPGEDSFGPMDSPSDQTKDNPSVGRRVGKFVVFNMIPGYPVYKALKSAKETAGTGVATVHDLVAELEKRKPQKKTIRTYRQALALRTADSLPLRTIARNCLNMKRLCLSVAFVSAAFVLGSVVGANYLGSFLGVLFVMFCLLHVVKYEHRLWQLDTGPLQPDEPLGGFGDFFRSNGAWLRLLSPHLSR
ncbi:hypothetical protein Q2T91_16115 [Ralstonia pseudosolanacearum]|uniref:hypothetical protein n=1 Tax=Ralstonia pseudosolanacearum TaxID=1310165 RepID=UPI00399C28A1